MDLNIHNQRFLVCGASSGFGCATAKALLREGAHVIAVARREELLKSIYSHFGSHDRNNCRRSYRYQNH